MNRFPALLRRTRRIGLMPLLFAGCVAGTMAAQAEDSDTPIDLIRVDGFAINNLHLALFANQTNRSPSDEASQIALLNELVNNVMIAKSPTGQALAERSDVAAALEVARSRLVAQAFVRESLQNVEVSDAQIQSVYDARYPEGGLSEYKARHVLVESEAEAREIIGLLDAGGDFAALASERSIGPSKTVGGDLGWFEGQQMVEEFADATARLEDGAYSKEPVQTDFGWHVILREESRAVPAPDLASVRDEIDLELRQEAVAESIATIRDASQIDILLEQ
jgi:peptidyl-prolyl cis-trans isomerase C